MTVLITTPALAMRWTGRMAPENSTAGKHSIGRASVAWATFLTDAEASRPRPSAAIAHNSRLTVIDAYVDERPARETVEQAEHAQHGDDDDEQERARER